MEMHVATKMQPSSGSLGKIACQQKKGGFGINSLPRQLALAALKSNTQITCSLAVTRHTKFGAFSLMADAASLGPSTMC
jgi:hypothetical protein